jgi:DNA-binding response OmpR family regulator
MKTVLIIESEQASTIMQFLLRKENFRVSTAGDVRRALPVIQAEAPDLVVLDLTSRRSTASIQCRELRNWSSAAILAVSNLPEERLIIEVLDAGADGFISLPVKPGELLARIRALLRWHANPRQSQDIIRSGDLEIDLTQRRICIGG